MAVIGTFGSFTAARLGIYAAQSSLNVTGNNIANINTEGYTRQRMDLVSLNSWGTARYANKMNLNIGYGVLTQSVSQLRDPYLDIRYRDEQSNVGASETWLDCLDQLSYILDEVGDGGDFGLLERQFNEFRLQLQQLNDAVGTIEYDTTVRSTAKVMTDLLNSYAKALETVENNQVKQLKDDVTSVNTILTQIRDLNVQIREAGISGGQALELRDSRNVLIDELSKYMKISVSYDMEKIDEFNSVERLNINIADSGNPPIRLICGIFGTQLDMPDETAMRNPDYNFDDPNDPNNWIDGPDKDANNNPIKVPRPKYVKTLDANGNPDELTDNYDDAIKVNNAKTDDENEGDNRLWMSIQPLVDEKGRVFRDAYGVTSTTVELGDSLLHGALQSRREFVTGKGEFSSELDVQYKSDATTTRGVPYYRYSLDGLAQQFAKMFNEANQFNFDQISAAYQMNDNEDAFVDAAGNEIPNITPKEFDDLAADIKKLAELKEKLSDKDLPEADRQTIQQQIKDLEDTDIEARSKEAYEKMETLRQEGQLTKEYAFYNGGVLFSSSGDANDPTGITAKNITISASWSTGEVRILNTKTPDTVIKDPITGEDKVLNHTTLNDNVSHMMNLMSEKLDYFPRDTVANAANSTRYFNGSFQERFADMNVILSVDKETTTTLFNSYTVESLSLDNSRLSVSGVDLNDEATSMMMFQKAYSAACQLMTTLDSMLDRLINGTL